MFSSRRQRARQRRLWLILNLVIAALSIAWLGTSDWVVQSRPAVQATLTRWARFQHTPSLFAKGLAWSGLAEDSGRFGEEYVPGSSQRILRPDEWSDPNLRIFVLAPAESRSVAAGAKHGIAEGETANQGTKAKANERPSTAESARGILKDKPRKLTRKTRASHKRNVAKHRRPIRKEWFTVTAYCPCKKCCGRWARYHRTASGLPLTYNGGDLVAADTRVLPFHTEVKIPGYAGGRAVPVVDRGSSIEGRMIDVFFPSHLRAKRWGKRRLLVEIVN